MKRWSVALGAIAFTAAAAWVYASSKPPGEADAADSRMVELGRTVYATHCAACHGDRMEGQPNWRERRPDGRLPAPPHDASGHTWHHPDRQLFVITKRGVAGVVPGYQSDMPAYADILSDQQIWAVIAYIKSRWPEAVRMRQPRDGRGG